MNKVILIGRLTDEPTNYSKEDKYMTKFNLAVDRRFKTEGQPTADFIPCVVFGKTAEFVLKYFHKGMKVALEGRLQTGSYVKDNVKHYTTDVIVEAAEFAESKRQETPQETPIDWIPPESIEQDLPFK